MPQVIIDWIKDMADKSRVFRLLFKLIQKFIVLLFIAHIVQIKYD